MNSGLYALAGASATATAAACANRLDDPMTNVSKVYFGFSRAGSTSLPRLGRLDRSTMLLAAVGPPVPAGARQRVGPVVRSNRRRRLRDLGRRRFDAPRSSPSGRRLDGDRDPDLPAVGGRQRAGDDRAEPALEDLLGELVGGREQRGVLDQAERPGQVDPGPVLGDRAPSDRPRRPRGARPRRARAVARQPPVGAGRSVPEGRFQGGRSGVRVLDRAVREPGRAVSSMGRVRDGSCHDVHTVIHSLWSADDHFGRDGDAEADAPPCRGGARVTTGRGDEGEWGQTSRTGSKGGGTCGEGPAAGTLTAPPDPSKQLSTGLGSVQPACRPRCWACSG